MIINELIKLMKDINLEQIPEKKSEKKLPVLLKRSLFLINNKKVRGLKISPRKQMLQRLPIALSQVKAGDTYENLLNEIRQIVYSLHRTKEITKIIYKNIKN